MSHATNNGKAPSVGALRELRAHVERWLGRLVGLSARWQYETRISPDKLVYRVRRKPDGTTQLQDTFGTWLPIEKVKWCIFDYEPWIKYHREQYEASVPLEPNTETCHGEDGAKPKTK